jgi:hypothetical protein
MTEFLNVGIGPCAVIFNPAGTPVTLEIHTEDGATFESELHAAQVMTAQAGKVPVSEVSQGRTGKLTVQVAETDLDKLAAMIKGATLTGSKLTVVNDVGNDLYALAKEVIVKPMKSGVISTTAAEWLHILKAYPKAKPVWKYNASGQRYMEIVFEGYPSKDSGYVGVVWMTGKTA